MPQNEFIKPFLRDNINWLNTKIPQVYYLKDQKFTYIIEQLNFDLNLIAYNFKMKYTKPDSDAGSETLDRKKIDWNDFNYPICLKIFHYNSDETPEALKWRVAFLRINHTLIIFAIIWNFINNIVDAVQGVDQGGIRIAISAFLILVWLPGAFYIFITPYLIYMKQDATTCIFYLISAFAIVWFFIWSIAGFADANGWVMVAQNSKAGRGAATFFSIVTSILMTIISILALVNLVLFWRREKTADE